MKEKFRREGKRRGRSSYNEFEKQERAFDRKSGSGFGCFAGRHRPDGPARLGSNPVTEVEARERLALDEPDFRPIGWLFDRDGASVLIEGAGGDYALVSRLGLDLVTRRFDPATMKATEESGVLTIRPGDPGSRAIRLVSPDAAAWARKLA